MTVKANVGELDWLLDDLVGRVLGAEHAVLLSADGLLMGRSADLSTGDAEHLAAVAASFQSLARGTGRQFGGGDVHQTVVEMERAFLVVTAAGMGACLALLASADADLGVIAYQMNLMVTQVGRYLASSPRNDLAERAAQAPTS
ncbi:dynein regulation protein LC7 [Gandjariella thermophila]|uniref:Dynein regulation protein LC7 n=2 Tax=Gandjariella thermophila TaxID=1931992 RepID=A0A4D4JAM7_9PSEU|nr:dynein regulation protein LC7 [Gandjariella thermophila]